MNGMCILSEYHIFFKERANSNQRCFDLSTSKRCDFFLSVVVSCETTAELYITIILISFFSDSVFHRLLLRHHHHPFSSLLQ